MEFYNREIIERVISELIFTVDLESIKVSRCLKSYLLLLDKCLNLENSRVKLKYEFSRHHALPRSIYPEFKNESDWNVVLMTHKEHFVAHHLLFEIYGRSGPMAPAYLRTCYGRFTKKFTKSSNLNSLKNWSYSMPASSRRKIGDSLRGRELSTEVRARMSEAQSGKTFSDESRLRMSIAKSGVNHPNYGKELPEIHRSNISKALTGLVRTEENRKNISEGRSGVSNVYEDATCVFCSGLFTTGGIKSHQSACLENPDRVTRKNSTSKVPCIYCSKLIGKTNISKHEKSCSSRSETGVKDEI